MKLYLVWNEDKTECVGFYEFSDAYYAAHQFYLPHMRRVETSSLAEAWIDLYGDEKCTIQEIEV